jgi:hypothetical protein
MSGPSLTRFEPPVVAASRCSFLTFPKFFQNRDLFSSFLFGWLGVPLLLRQPAAAFLVGMFASQANRTRLSHTESMVLRIVRDSAGLRTHGSSR